MNVCIIIITFQSFFKPFCIYLYSCCVVNVVVFVCADIVFFIFLYQRWIYRVDPKRVNEFGTSGDDHHPIDSSQREGTQDSEVQHLESNSVSQEKAVGVEKTHEEKKNE